MFFFFNHTATTEIYTLSLHDALPISNKSCPEAVEAVEKKAAEVGFRVLHTHDLAATLRSEEHTSELQSLTNLVCRLLLEKKNVNDRRAELPAVGDIIRGLIQ